MGYFKEPEVKRLTLSKPDYWVDVITDLQYGDMKKFAGISHDGQVDFVTSADLFLQTIIKAWNLDDEAGNVLEITPENINRLDQADAVSILNEAGGLVETDNQKKTSPSK